MQKSDIRELLAKFDAGKITEAEKLLLARALRLPRWGRFLHALGLHGGWMEKNEFTKFCPRCGYHRWKTSAGQWIKLE